MSGTTYGDDKKEQVMDVLRVLLDTANTNYENFDDKFNKDYSDNKYVNFSDPKESKESEGKYGINVDTTLKGILVLLRNHKETKNKEYYNGRDAQNIQKNLGDIIKEYLVNFLGICKDSRTKTRGSSLWRFTLILPSEVKHIDKNIELISELWDEKKKEKNKKPQNNDPYDKIPPQYKALIESKLKLFVGREFVFEEFERFLEDNPKGYFTVIGEPGIGKSAIAAKYVYDKQVPCFFNIASQGSNTTEQFLQEIYSQLREHYKIYGNQNNLLAILQSAREQLEKDKKQDEKLVIVVDALDEASISQEQKRSGENILCLPQNLPNNVYFFLTRRPYGKQEKRLKLDPEIKDEKLDINEEKYRENNEQDIKSYLTRVLDNDEKTGKKIISWIQKRKIKPDNFIPQLLEKSQINFMYLRYVIADIANGEYDDVKLDDLPQGLLGYYRDHWRRMEMDEDSKEIEVKVLLTLVTLLTETNSKDIQVTSSEIANYLKKTEGEVKDILGKWKEFLLVKEDENKEIFYRFYHKSFLDFLKEEQIESGAHCELFYKIKQDIAKSTFNL